MIKWIMYIGVFIAFLFALVFFLGRILEVNPVTYPLTPFALRQRVYTQGEQVIFSVTRCATKDTSYKFAAELVNKKTSVRKLLGGANVFAREGCETIDSVPELLPDPLEEGTYSIEFVIESEGIFRNFKQSKRTDYFLVKNARK